MFLKLKKFSLVLSLVFGVQVTAPHEAHAIAAGAAAIAGSGGAAVLAIAGFSAIGAGVLLAPLSQYDRAPEVYSFFAFIGLILLPGDSQNQAAELIAINSAQAQQLEASEAEINEYNAHLIQINMAKQEITAAIQSGEITSVKQIRQAWLSYKDAGLISPVAFKVFEQISTQVAKTISKEL